MTKLFGRTVLHFDLKASNNQKGSVMFVSSLLNQQSWGLEVDPENVLEVDQNPLAASMNLKNQ